MSRHTLALGAWLALAVVTGACRSAATPTEVAQAFWSAAAAGDRARLQALIAPGTGPSGDTAELLPVRQAVIGKVTLGGDTARVQTTVTLDADPPLEVPLETVLVRHQGRWLVDYSATVAAIERRGELGQVLDELAGAGEALAERLDRSLDELQRTMPRVRQQLQEIERRLRARLPALRERLEALARELEQALPKHEAPSEPPRRSPPQPEQPPERVSI